MLDIRVSSAHCWLALETARDGAVRRRAHQCIFSKTEPNHYPELQNLDQATRVPYHSSQANQVRHGGNTVQNAKLSIQLLHGFRVWCGVVSLLAISRLYSAVSVQVLVREV